MGKADQKPSVLTLLQQLRILLLQLASLAILSGILLQFGKQEFAHAALIGGLIAIIPYHYFVARAFRMHEAENVLRFKQSLARGQVGRYLLTAALFAIALKFDSSLNPWSLFGGFGLILLTQMVGTVIVLSNSEKQ